MEGSLLKQCKGLREKTYVFTKEPSMVEQTPLLSPPPFHLLAEFHNIIQKYDFYT